LFDKGALLSILELLLCNLQDLLDWVIMEGAFSMIDPSSERRKFHQK
jgi:hypothetical protein